MLKSLLHTFFLLMVLSTSFASAQHNTAPWPPNPEDIFAEGVEIENIWITDSEGSTQVQPNQIRAFTINGKTYPWPENFEDAWVDDASFDESPFNVVEGMSYIFAIQKGESEAQSWQLNLSTGDYRLYEADTIATKCGEISIYGLSEKWLFFEDRQGVHLCQPSTGFLSKALPDDVNWNVDKISDMPVGISESTDGEWLAFFGYESDTVGLQTSLYSYYLPTQQLTNLGTFVRDPHNLTFFLWVDTQVLFSTRDMPEWSTTYIYIADAARSNSLEFATQRFRYAPEYYDNPPRFEFIRGTEGGNSIADCTWIRYDISSRREQSYKLGSLCDAEYGVVDGTGYYRDVQPAFAPEAALVRFNPITKTREELFRAEIEAIEWVSTDERYAVLILDSNSRVDAIPFYPVYMWGTPQNPYLALVSLVSGEILYQTPTTWIGRDYYVGENWNDFAGSASYIQPLANNAFFLVQAPPDKSASASLLELENDQLIHTPLPLEIVAPMPYAESLLIWRDSQEISTAVDIYDIATGITTPFTKAIDNNLYRLEFKPLRENFLFVYLFSANDERSVRYGIYLPQPEN
jgi:hypothetical protein